MRTFIHPTQDASIFSKIPTLNAGLDEVLYIGKDSGSNSIRSLIQFDLSTISQSISNGNIPANCDFYLNLKLANAESLSQNVTVYMYPVSQSWVEGTGLSIQDVSNPNDGASWTFRTQETWWGPSYSSSISASVTQSFTSSIAGSDYITTPSCSFTFSTPTTDIRTNINSIVSPWLSGSIQNNGLLLKLLSSIENSISSSDNIAIFSKDTHTVYIPTLEISWNDQTFSTGTLNPAPITVLYVSLGTLRSTYNKNATTRINVYSREEYPLKTFDTIFRYNTTEYLPTSSYYSITDVQTNEIVIPFDSYSLISCDSTGNYFTLDTSPLYIGRKYSVSVKVVSSAYTDVFKMPNAFEVV